MHVISGQYTGSTTLPITVPTGLAHIDVLLVKTSGQRAVLWLNSHPQYQVRELGTTVPMAVPAGFTVNVPEGSFVTPSWSGGLVVDARLNNGAFTHDWIAIQCDGLDSAVGSYVGNLADNRMLDHIGWSPTVALVHRDSDIVQWRSDQEAGDVTYPMDGAAVFSNRLQALNALGLELGSSTTVNGNGTTFHYFVARDVASILNVVPYTGTGLSLIHI